MPIIPKEQSATYQRWHMDSFDAPPVFSKPAPEVPDIAPPVVEEESPTLNGIPLPTAESVALIHEEARREGHDEGFAAGEKAGYEAGLEQARQEAERFTLLAGNFANALATLDQNVADAVLELALTVARQVMQQQLESHPDAILAVIRAALTSLPLHHGTINILVHPDDAHFLREQLGNQVTQSGWHLIDDSSIERGGCLIRAGASEVDATFATRWRRVLESLGKTNNHDAT